MTTSKGFQIDPQLFDVLEQYHVLWERPFPDSGYRHQSTVLFRGADRPDDAMSSCFRAVKSPFMMFRTRTDWKSKGGKG